MNNGLLRVRVSRRGEEGKFLGHALSETCDCFPTATTSLGSESPGQNRYCKLE